MKTLITMMIFVFALAISGCATTQGSGSGGGSMSKGDSMKKSGGMLTKEDYKRMGIDEMGAK
jgi:hypothetical protein